MYAHLGTVLHRSEVVEFRIEQHLEALKDRLGHVGFVTRNVTRDRAGEGKEDPSDTEASTGTELPEWARRDSNARPLAPEASLATSGRYCKSDAVQQLRAVAARSRVWPGLV